MSGAGRDLRVAGLSAGYRGRRVIHDLSLPEIAPGEVVALVGPNAAGKSTLLRALAGLVPSSGTIALGDLDLTRLGLAERARHVAFMPQASAAATALTVLEGVITALRASPVADGATSERALRARAVSVLDRFGIDRLAMEPLDRLSGGQRQLASLAQAAVREPRLLLLDEPTSALDLGHQLRVMRFVRGMARERGTVVVIVLHDLATACRWGDSVAVLSQGRVVEYGPPEEAVTPGMLARVYGVEATVERSIGGHAYVSITDDLPPTGAWSP